MTLGQAEKNFLIRKVGVNAPISELKKRFYTSQGATGFSINDLEVVWLAIAIVVAGGTPVGNHTPDLWKQLNAISGFKVSNYKNENKMTYYLNAS